MILTGETEILGEKHYTAWVVDGWMSMEQWWNDTVPVPLCPRGGHYYCFLIRKGGGGARCKFRLGQIPILRFTVGHDHCPIRRLRLNTVIQDSVVK